MTTGELTAQFQKLSATEKIAFFKTVMPTLCELFKNDPQRMMAEMMPLCREMMQSCSADMPQVMWQMMPKMR
jgi:membrane protein insertase Oxa1/YidC/SpoIIIJ